MIKISFKNQLILGVIIVIVANTLGFITKLGIFCNIGLIIYGLLFLINPVFPEKSKNVKHIKLYVRLIGLFIIVLSFLIRYNF